MHSQQSGLPTKESILDAYRSGELARHTFQRFGCIDEKALDEVAAICADLHNAGRLDLFLLKDTADFTQAKATHFFQGQHFFCKVIPKLDASVTQMMEFVDLLVQKGGNDLAANQPNGAFLEWCKSDLSRARHVVHAAQQHDSLACKFLTFALIASDMASDATAFITEHTDDRRLAAISALGRMNYADREAAEAALSVLESLLEPHPDDVTAANILPAALEIAKKFGRLNSGRLDSIIALACEAPGPSTQFGCARALWAEGKFLSKGAIECLLCALSRLDPSHTGTIQELDLALHTLLDTPHVEQAVEFLTNLLSRPENSISLSAFPSFNQHLLDGPTDRFFRVFVSWMLTGAHELCEGISKLLRRADRERAPVVLPIQESGLSAAKQIFLCRKAVGYLFLEPVVASSVLVSVLRGSDDKVQESALKLLGLLLFNYGGTVRDYLTSIDVHDAAHVSVREALTENDQYLTDLESVGNIRELHSSEDQRQIERLREFDRARRIRKEAEKGSIFFDLVKRSTILYGKRSLTYVEDRSGGRQPFEMELKAHSAYIELPRMEVLDPVGLSYMLLVFRTERPPP
jgi:hypothetical protein